MEWKGGSQCIKPSGMAVKGNMEGHNHHFHCNSIGVNQVLG